MLEFGGFNVFFNVNRCKRNTLVSFHFDRGKFSCSFYPKVLPGFSIQKESAPSLLRGRLSGCHATLPLSGERCVTSRKTAAKETTVHQDVCNSLN